MSRAHRIYDNRSEFTHRFEGIDASEPAEGFYRFRLRSGGVFGVVRLRYGPPDDPITGEPLDRSWRWQADFNGEYVDLHRVWPACARNPVTEADYRRAIKRQEWAQEHAPGTAYADPRARHDPLSSPMPF